MIKIKNKQINGEILNCMILNVIIEKILQNKKKIKEWFKFIFLIGMFQMIGFTVLVLVALVHGGTAKTSVLTFTMPIWANLLALYLLNEKMTNKQILAIAVSLIGLILILINLIMMKKLIL